MMPRQPDAQLFRAHGRRKNAVRIGAERFFDHIDRPDLQRLRHQLRTWKPLPERRRDQLDVARINGFSAKVNYLAVASVRSV
jgi:hypothetical protein